MLAKLNIFGNCTLSKRKSLCERVRFSKKGSNARQTSLRRSFQGLFPGQRSKVATWRVEVEEEEGGGRRGKRGGGRRRCITMYIQHWRRICHEEGGCVACATKSAHVFLDRQWKAIPPEAWAQGSRLYLRCQPELGTLQAASCAPCLLEFWRVQPLGES